MVGKDHRVAGGTFSLSSSQVVLLTPEVVNVPLYSCGLSFEETTSAHSSSLMELLQRDYELAWIGWEGSGFVPVIQMSTNNEYSLFPTVRKQDTQRVLKF